MYPESLFIHIVRDPRCSALSYLIKKHHKSVTFPCAGGPPRISWPRAAFFFAKRASQWVQWLEAARSASEILPEASWMEIRYEDFVDNPRRILESICSRIGIGFEDKMLDPETRKDDPVLKRKDREAHKNIAKDFDRTRAESYRELPPPLIRVVESVAGPWMQKNGYPILNPRIGIFSRGFVGFLLWAFQNRLKKESVPKACQQV
jgi:hypothetical protein